MTLEIINTRKQKLTDNDIRGVAEIEEHPEISKWDIPAFGGDVERAFAGFKKSLSRVTGDEFLVAKTKWSSRRICWNPQVRGRNRRDVTRR